MRSTAATVMAAAALLVATGALAASVVVLDRPALKLPPPQPLGVCVLLNDSFADTTVTAIVDQATRVNGVVTCEAGSYVPVTPK